MKKQFITLSLIGLIAAAHPVMAQQAKKPAATPAEIAQLRAAVEKDIENAAVHEAYIKAADATSPEALAQYDQWIKKYPKSATVPLVIGEALADHEDPKARPYLLKATEINPKLVSAWRTLSTDAERWGDFKQSTAYLAKALEASPNDPDLNFYYAMQFDKDDVAKYEALSVDLAKRFPESQRSAQALYWLAVRLPDPAKKFRYAEMLATKFPPEKYRWSKYGMDIYYEQLYHKDPKKALQLIEKMLAAKGAEKGEIAEWTRRKELTEKVIQARAQASRPDEALAILKNVNARRDVHVAEDLVLLKASFEAAAGRPQQAYDSLMKYQVRTPAEKVQEMLVVYGGKLGKTPAAVAGDIQAALIARGVSATPFTLNAYLTQQPVSLSDYKGKVVLLTYWFPGCGPCRGEFPHFENVLKKYRGKDVVYLAINIAREQDDYVVPFVKTSGYSFTPLADDPKRDKGNLPSPGAPTNYLIDKDGRIIYSNFMIHGDNERMLELMINSILGEKVS